LNKPPAFQFYAKDWISSKTIQTSTAEQCGWYINLIACAWDSDQPGVLPNDMDKLWKLAHAESREKFESEGVEILAQFPVVRGGKKRHNVKLVQQFAAIKARHESVRVAGERGAKSRWGNKLHSDAINSPMANDSSSSSSAFAYSVKDKNKAAPKNGACVFELPEWIPIEAWKSYEEMRNSNRKKMTTRAREMAVQMLAKLKEEGNDPGAVLAQSVFKSYTGLWPINGGSGNGRRESKTAGNKEAFNQALRDLSERDRKEAVGHS